MSGEVKVDSAGIETLITDMKKGCDQLTARLGQMDGDLKKYITQWEGGAQKAYHVAQADWKKQIDELKLILEDVRQAVLQAKEDYLAGEHTNEQSWSS